MTEKSCKNTAIFTLPGQFPIRYNHARRNESESTVERRYASKVGGKAAIQCYNRVRVSCQQNFKAAAKRITYCTAAFRKLPASAAGGGGRRCRAFSFRPTGPTIRSELGKAVSVQESFLRPKPGSVLSCSLQKEKSQC